MIHLTEVTFDDATPIDSYGPGFFRIGGQVMFGAVVVTADAARSWGGMEDLDTVRALIGTVDFVLLGTGRRMVQPPAALRALLEEAGIGIELMSSDSAARTYNVLLAEGRRMAALLLPVDGGQGGDG